MAHNIAIDGPAGAGKSTVARLVAEELNFIYVDTGAMYRAIAFGFLKHGTDVDDIEAVKERLSRTDISISYEAGVQHVLRNGTDVSGLIRTEEVGNLASKTAALPCVREKLLELQRRLAKENDVVMDGRDIGTNILPDAGLKIYLTASVETRAARRYQELTQKGQTCALAEIEEDIRRRDAQDMNRAIAPLSQAEDAVYLDSSDMTVAEVVNEIVARQRSIMNDCCI